MAAVNQSPGDILGLAAGRWFEELDDRGVFITDEHLVVRRWNAWLAAQTGNSAQEMIGQRIFDLYPALVERGIDTYYREALAGESRILSERFHKFLLPITRNFHGVGQTDMAQSARIEPLTADGKVVGTITLIEDVTERVITERELRAQIAASEQARRFAEDTSRLKDEFLATLSHEIRTPLNAVIGWTRMLRTPEAVRSPAHALDAIERNALSQMRLVEDLLDMSRIISGKLQLKVETIAVADVVQSALDVIMPAAAAKKITIETVFEPGTTEISGDADRLQQVAWNLLSNSVKFTPPGGRVRIEVARQAGDVRLTVSDTGQGIAREFLPFVFDRFRQADASASRRQGGLGLGLALVRQIVELHGGSVGVESAGAHSGTTFWVTLPIRSAAKPTEDEPPSMPTPATLSGVNILIVDDDSDARELLVAMLENFGATARAVDSAAAALAILNDESADRFRTHVLISDLGLPDTDGLTLLRQVRQAASELVRKMPAIAVTAYATPEDRVRALVAGYQHHIPKPVDGNVLASVIAHLVAAK
jgi:PAS domain S-box-containing protein